MAFWDAFQRLKITCSTFLTHDVDIGLEVALPNGHWYWPPWSGWQEFDATFSSLMAFIFPTNKTFHNFVSSSTLHRHFCSVASVLVVSPGRLNIRAGLAVQTHIEHKKHSLRMKTTEQCYIKHTKWTINITWNGQLPVYIQKWSHKLLFYVTYLLWTSNLNSSFNVWNFNTGNTRYPAHTHCQTTQWHYNLHTIYRIIITCQFISPTILANVANF